MENLVQIGNLIAAYSGGPTLSGVPAGARPEGSEFEKAVFEGWLRFVDHCKGFARVDEIEPARKGQPEAICLSSKNGPWELYLRHRERLAELAQGRRTAEVPPIWLQRRFLVSDLLEAHLGSPPYTFAPRDENDSAKYHGDNYLKMYKGKSTKFDYSGALVENGQLKEKLLFEYKYCKSSNDISVDGNAHERLGFQVLQYLEVALQVPVCSLNVVGAQAFSEYKNKYHPAFNQQAIRLNSSFGHVHFRFAACRSDYIALFASLANYLDRGELPPVEYRDSVR